MSAAELLIAWSRPGYAWPAVSATAVAVPTPVRLRRLGQRVPGSVNGSIQGILDSRLMVAGRRDPWRTWYARRAST